MNTLRTVLAPAMALAVWSTHAATLTLAPNPAFGFAPTDFNPAGVINVSKWDPIFGTLQSVTLGVIGELQSGVSNIGGQNTMFQGTVATTFTLTGISGGPVSLAISNPLGPISLDPGQASPISSTFSSTTTPASPIPNLNLSEWQASGGGFLPITVNTLTSVNWVSGQSSASLFNQGKISLTVTYTYEPSANIPEPATYGAIGALISLGLLGYRQYRLRRA